LKKLSKKYVWLMQAALVAGSGYLLFSKLSQISLAENIAHVARNFLWWHIPILLALSAINWAFDTRVWQIILKPFINLPFFKALKINVIAQSAGAITPLQAGDYGLRSLLLRGQIESRQNALLSLAYRLVKMAVRLVVGLVFVFLAMRNNEHWALGVALGIILLLGGSFSIRSAVNWLSRTRQADKMLQNRERLNFTDLRLTKSFVPAILLFTAYSAECALIITWAEAAPSFWPIFQWVVITYSITSFLPATGIFDPLIKSAFGAMFAMQLDASPIAILLGFTITWLINLGVPGFISALFFKKITGLHQPISSATT